MLAEKKFLQELEAQLNEQAQIKKQHLRLLKDYQT